MNKKEKKPTATTRPIETRYRRTNDALTYKSNETNIHCAHILLFPTRIHCLLVYTVQVYSVHSEISMHRLMSYAQWTNYIPTLDNLSNLTNAFETKDHKSQNSNWHFQNSWRYNSNNNDNNKKSLLLLNWIFAKTSRIQYTHFVARGSCLTFGSIQYVKHSLTLQSVAECAYNISKCNSIDAIYE